MTQRLNCSVMVEERRSQLERLLTAGNWSSWGWSRRLQRAPRCVVWAGSGLPATCDGGSWRCLDHELFGVVGKFSSSQPVLTLRVGSSSFVSRAPDWCSWGSRAVHPWPTFLVGSLSLTNSGWWERIYLHSGCSGLPCFAFQRFPIQVERSWRLSRALCDGKWCEH